MNLAKRFLVIGILSASCSAALAAQPADGGYDVIQQASNECGPTITWLMMNHHYQGAILKTGNGRTDFYNATLPPVCVGDVDDCTSRNATIHNASEYAGWIEAQRDGKMSPSLRFLSERLTEMRDPATGKRMFEVEGNYDIPSKSNVSERVSRLATIRQHLDNNRPVMIHLERPWFIPGHYVSLVGYERTAKGYVYSYVDTVQPEKGLLEVAEADLAGADAWYDNGSVNYLARWTGRYMTFWPVETATAPTMPEVEPQEPESEKEQAPTQPAPADEPKEEKSSGWGWLSWLWSW